MTTQAQFQAPAKTNAKTGKPATQAAPAAAKPVMQYAVVDFARPKAGTLLFAYTQAVIELLGLEKKAVDKIALRKAWGETAVIYHSRNENLEGNDNGALKLSAKGRAFFEARMTENAVSRELVEAYIACMTTGVTNDAVNVRTAQALVPFSPTPAKKATAPAPVAAKPAAAAKPAKQAAKAATPAAKPAAKAKPAAAPKKAAEPAKDVKGAKVVKLTDTRRNQSTKA